MVQGAACTSLPTEAHAETVSLPAEAARLRIHEETDAALQNAPEPQAPRSSSAARSVGGGSVTGPHGRELVHPPSAGPAVIAEESLAVARVRPPIAMSPVLEVNEWEAREEALASRLIALELSTGQPRRITRIPGVERSQGVVRATQNARELAAASALRESEANPVAVPPNDIAPRRRRARFVAATLAEARERRRRGFASSNASSICTSAGSSIGSSSRSSSSRSSVTSSAQSAAGSCPLGSQLAGNAGAALLRIRRAQQDP